MGSPYINVLCFPRTRKVMGIVVEQGPITRSQVEHAMDLPLRRLTRTFQLLEDAGYIARAGKTRLAERGGGKESILYVAARPVDDLPTLPQTEIDRQLARRQNVVVVDGGRRSISQTLANTPRPASSNLKPEDRAQLRAELAAEVEKYDQPIEKLPPPAAPFRPINHPIGAGHYRR